MVAEEMPGGTGSKVGWTAQKRLLCLLDFAEKLEVESGLALRLSFARRAKRTTRTTTITTERGQIGGDQMCFN